MTPENAAALAGLLRDYGLPIVMLGGLGWLMLRGKLVTGRELDKMTALYERERADRIAAEQLLAKFGGASVDFSEQVRDALATVIRKDEYAERLHGDPRRDR